MYILIFIKKITYQCLPYKIKFNILEDNQYKIQNMYINIHYLNINKYIFSIN